MHRNMMENYATLILALFITTLIPSESSKVYQFKEFDYSMNILYVENINSTAIEDIPKTTFDTVMTVNKLNINNPSNRGYIQLAKMKRGALSIGIISRTTNETMFLGSNRRDVITFDDKLKSAAGLNEADTYIVKKESPAYVWINNQATDNVLDTLKIPAETIEIYNKTKLDNSIVEASQYDLVLRYYNSTEDPEKFVVLKNYLKSDLLRHLKLVTSMEDFLMIVPSTWVYENSSLNFDGQYYLDDYNDLYSLKDSVPLPYNMPIMSTYAFPIFNVYDKKCTFYLRKNMKDADVTNLYINDGRGNAEAMSARLVDLLKDDGTVSDEWREKFFIVVYDDNTPRKILTITELLRSLY